MSRKLCWRNQLPRSVRKRAPHPHRQRRNRRPTQSKSSTAREASPQGASLRFTTPNRTNPKGQRSQYSTRAGEVARLRAVRRPHPTGTYWLPMPLQCSHAFLKCVIEPGHALTLVLSNGILKQLRQLFQSPLPRLSPIRA